MVPEALIDYVRISDAMKHYRGLGYRLIATPWLVDKRTLAVTFNGDRESTEMGYLVGSAEQGFIELMFKGLPPGKYVSAGPCFRFEDKDKLYFFKVELIHYGSKDYESILQDARRFLGGQVVDTDLGKDLMLNGLEIGSYGTRTYCEHTWAYGTGVAEPRYSMAKGLVVV